MRYNAPRSREVVVKAIQFRTTLIILTALLVVGLAACSGGGTPAPRTIKLEALDIEWSETALSAQAGQPITVVVENKGVLDHNFVIEELGIEVHLQPGDKEEVTFVVDEAGTYQYLCTIPGHLDAGMLGTLTIEP